MRKSQYEEESSEPQNKLDIAFIAENSKEVGNSSSVSMSEDNFSVSSISRRHSQLSQPSQSPFHFYPEMSMDEWPVEEPEFFSGKALNEEKLCRREKDQIEEQYPCTKKRLNDKMKVVTVKATPLQKTQKKHLRSPLKNSMNEQEDSGSQQLRQIVEEMGKNKKTPTKGDENFYSMKELDKIPTNQ